VGRVHAETNRTVCNESSMSDRSGCRHLGRLCLIAPFAGCVPSLLPQRGVQDRPNIEAPVPLHRVACNSYFDPVHKMNAASTFKNQNFTGLFVAPQRCRWDGPPCGGNAMCIALSCCPRSPLHLTTSHSVPPQTAWVSHHVNHVNHGPNLVLAFDLDGPLSRCAVVDHGALKLQALSRSCE